MPWARNSAPSILAASSAKHSMKAWPMRRRFSCGSVDAGQRVEKPVLGLDDVQVGLESGR